ncbi:hypothetical protein ALC57_09702, partial [Trachymyrmex cornetzi]
FRNYVMMLVLSIWYFMKSTHVSGVRNITHGISKHIRSIGFPEGSNTGIFFALGIPLDIPDKSVAVSFYFEANYPLPFELNSSYFYEGTYYAKRSLSRQLVYKVFTNKIDNFGYPGLDCLLRTICEAGKYSLNENGVLGDILRIIFTPSMSMSEDLPDEIIEAESEQHCNQRYERCPVNLLDLASY